LAIIFGKIINIHVNKATSNFRRANLVLIRVYLKENRVEGASSALSIEIDQKIHSSFSLSIIIVLFVKYRRLKVAKTQVATKQNNKSTTTRNKQTNKN